MLSLETNILAITLAIAGLLYTISATRFQTLETGTSLLEKKKIDDVLKHLSKCIVLYFYSLLIHFFLYLYLNIVKSDGDIHNLIINFLIIIGIILFIIGISILFGCRNQFRFTED